MSSWTKEQLDAINARGTGIIVSAAAGSGKTSVLVERLIRILSDTENRISADRLVVVTFTNDAAAQMKQRLSDALSEKIASEPDNVWLCRQQALLQTAKISTIHSFCFDMIRENIQSLDVSAGFRILDDAEESMLMRNAAGEAFEKFYADKPEIMEKLCGFFSGSARGDTELEKTVLDIYGFLVSVPFYRDKTRKWTEYYSAGFDPENDPMAKIYIKHIEKKYDGFIKRAKYLNELFSDIAGRTSAALESDAELFMSLKEQLCKDLPWDERVILPEISFKRMDSVRGLEENEKAVQDSIMKQRNKYKDEMKKLSAGIFSAGDINDDYLKHADMLECLFSLIECFEEELRALKNEKNALSFSDAEQLAVSLLAVKDDDGNIVKTPLAKELSDYYEMIMIDEFQDANDNQDLIFKMLSKNGTAEKGGTDLFTVGDVKQSIYRFRLANPKLFMKALDISEKYTGDDFKGTNASVFLNKNFRSSKEVIGFVNYIFGSLMSRETGDVDYNSDEALVQGMEYHDGERDTEIIIAPDDTDDTENNSDEDEDGAEENLYADSEAKAAALKIASMIGKRTVSDKGTERVCEPRDFCILMRSGKKADVYVKALAGLGIKAHAEEPEGYLRSREISVLLSMLAVIDNPMQDIPLATVLMSPMFMLDAEDMALLASVKKEDEKYFSAIKNVLSGETEISEDQILFSKLGRFMEMFVKLRYCAASQKLDRFIRTIYDSTDFLSSVQTYKDGNIKRANLRLLLDVAESYEKNSGGGISGFVRYTDNLVRRGGDLRRASVVSANDNAVSIKTIHRSKGLEYPFVFLCGTSTGFNTSDLKKRIQISSEFGIGFKIQDREKLRLYDSFPRYVIAEINRADAVSEEMRLLYVALTRAKEQLFITIPDSPKVRKKIDSVRMKIAMSDGELSDAAREAGSMLDWISAAMLVHKDGEWFRDGVSLPVKENGITVRTNNITAENISPQEENSGTAAPDPAKIHMLEEMFAYSYDSEKTSQPAKITVTEIAKSETGDKLFLRRPEFAAEKGGLTAAEKGTAMHTFMQYADYPAAEKDILSEAERLAENGMLTQEEKNSLNIPQLEAFFQSELYARMKNSDKIRREQKFLVKKSDAGLDDYRLMEYNKDSMLQGIADCMFEENGEIVLVDYKTDRVTSPSVLVSRYDLQIKLYGAALGRIFGKRVKEAYLYSFSLGMAVKAPLGAETSK